MNLCVRVKSNKDCMYHAFSNSYTRTHIPLQIVGCYCGCCWDAVGTLLGRYWDAIVEGPIPCVCEHLLCVEITTGARHGGRIYESAIMGRPSFLAIAHDPSCPFNNPGHCLWGWPQKGAPWRRRTWCRHLACHVDKHTH